MSYDVKVRIGAETSELASGISNAVEHVKKMGTAVEATAGDTRKLDDALTRYMSRLDPAYRMQVLLAQGVDLLDENLKAGNISAQTHAEMLTKVEAAYGAATAGAQKNGTAVAGVGKAHGMEIWRIQAFTHSIRASADQLMAGQNPAQVLGMQISQLAMTTTGTSFKLFGLAAATLAVAGGLALAIAKAESADRTLASLDATFRATGRAGLVSAGDLKEVVHQLSLLPGVTRTAATDIVTEFARARSIGGGLFRDLTSIVGDYAYVTGRETPDAAKSLAKSFGDPVAGARTLHDELGVLDGKQMLAIEHFARLGETAKAQALLFEALRDRVRGLHGQLTPLEEQTGNLAKAWDNLMRSMSQSGIINAARSALAGLLNDVASLMGSLDAKIANLQARKAKLLAAQEDSAGVASWLEPAGLAEINRQLDILLAKKRALEGAGSVTPSGKLAGADQGDSPVGGTPRPDAGAGGVDRVKLLEDTKGLADIEERRAALNDVIARLKKGMVGASEEEARILSGRILEAERQRDELKGKGDASRVEAMRQELEDMKAQEDGFLDFSKRKELEFWEDKLSTLRKGSADYAQVHREVYTLRRAVAKEDFDREIADLKVQVEAKRKDGEERVRLAQEIARRTGETYGQESVQYKQALREVETAQREHVEQVRQLKAMELEAAQAHEQTQLDLRRQNLAFMREMGQINSRQEIQGLRELEQQQFALELQTLQDKLQLQGLEVKERAQINHQIEALQSQHQVKMDQLRKKEVTDERARWMGIMQPATSAMASATTAVLTRAQTWRQGMASVGQAMLSQFVGTIYRMVEEWIAGQVAMGTVSATRATEEVTIQTQAALAGAVAVRSAAVANISAKAAEGGAAAGASVAYWPYWGWAAAPGVAAETYGMLMSFTAGLAVPSAAGGWEVPRDTLAMVHEDEMILPASISDHIRDSMGAGGRSGGTVEQHDHWHISAVDAKSVEKLFMRNQGALGRTMRRMRRNAALPDAS